MRIIPLAAFAALVAASAAQAQVPDHAVGIGVSLNPSALLVSGSGTTLMLPAGFGNIFLPIISGPQLKIEPEFGIWRESSSSSSSGYSSSASTTLLRVGAGLFRFVRVGGGTALYVGPRVVMIRESESDSYTGSTSSSSHRTNWSYGLAVGGEHFFSPHFSLGGEVQLNYVKIGDVQVDSGSPSSGSTDSHLISNNGLIFIRLYR